MTSTAITIDELEDELDLSGGWQTQPVKDTVATNAELYLPGDKVEKAALEVIRDDDNTTILELHHEDYPEWNEINTEVPGHVGTLIFESFSAAVDVLRVLIEKERFDEVVELVLSGEPGAPTSIEDAVEHVQD